MTTPPLLQLANIGEYRLHFERELCAQPLRTSNGTPVFVRRSDFDHACYESSRRDGIKNQFSTARATRMDWIGLTLAEGAATRVQGWDSKLRTNSPERCVFHAFESFVVVVRLGRSTDGNLKGNFVTAFHADNSLSKILSAPTWTYADYQAWETRTR